MDNGKEFAKTSDEIRQLLPDDVGGCLATDRILVDGRPVGYMYREVDRANPIDNGWRFFAGDESPEYLDNPANSGIYALNTIANYDPDIIPYLDTPAPCAFEKIPNSHKYRPVDPPVSD